MQNKLNPIIQAIGLIIVPLLVILILNFIMGLTGRSSDNSVLVSSLKMSLFVIPNSLYIICHKYKVSYLGFIVAGIATYLVVNMTGNNDSEILSTLSLYIFHFVYFALLIAVSYFAYFVIKGFKLKNLIFIIGGIITHVISFVGLFLMNKQNVDLELIRAIMLTGANTFLMVGLSLAIGLLLFELPEAQVEAEYYDDDIENL
jgi:hypothetical protein